MKHVISTIIFLSAFTSFKKIPLNNPYWQLVLSRTIENTPLFKFEKKIYLFLLIFLPLVSTQTQASCIAFDGLECASNNSISLENGINVLNKFQATIDDCQVDIDNIVSLTKPPDKSVLNTNSITFEWNIALNSVDCLTPNLSYTLTILDGAGANSLQEAINFNNVVSTNNFTISSSISQQLEINNLSLNDDETYIWKVSFVDACGNLIESGWFSFYKVNSQIPDEILELPNENICEADCQNIFGSSFKTSATNSWNIENGNPVFDFTGDGCEDEGFVKLSANSTQSDVISTLLLDPITQDKHYEVQICMRTSSNDLRVQIVAFNGNPTSFGASSNVAMMVYTGKIPATPGNSWSTANFPIWTANKNFNKLAVMLVNDTDSPINSMDIDNICIQEVAENPCPPDYDFTIDLDGNIGYPDWLNNLISNLGLTTQETTTEIDEGSVVDLYGHKYDVTLNDWYNEDNPPCHSIGNIPIDTLATDSLFQTLVDSLSIDTAELNYTLNLIAPIIEQQTIDSVVNGGKTVDFAPLTPINKDINKCLYFDGVDDVITTNIITNIPNFTFPPLPISYEYFDDNWTFDFYIKGDANQISNAPTLISNLTENSFPFWVSGFRIFIHDDPMSQNKTLAFEFVPPNVIGTSIVSLPNNSGKNILDGNFRNISLSKDGNVLRFYIDGDLVGNTTLPSSIGFGGVINTVSIKNNTPLRIGNDLKNNAFKGVIRDVRIWNKTRNDNEIKTGVNTKKRYSFNEDELLVNFELFNLLDQKVHNNAGGFYPNLFHLENHFHYGLLGLDNQVNQEDPSASDCSLCIQPFEEDNTKPFGGRDIVYVHGLHLEHLCDELDPSSNTFKGVWPIDEDDFYEGDFQQNAYSKFEEHIKRELGSLNNPSNNYMVASYNCAQRLGDGINSVASQIKEAMETGRNVVWSENHLVDGYYCTPTFGNEIVIITHSTGGLLVSSLLGLAEVTNPSSPVYDASYNSIHGDLSQITNEVKLHIAMTPALSGSPFANFALNVAERQKLGNAPIILDLIELLAGNFLATQALSSCDLSTLNIPQGKLSEVMDKSVLVDLYSVVAKLLWADQFYKHARIPTITVAGGYLGIPSNGVGLAESLFAKYLIIPGLDDGVVTMDCACGRQPTLLGGRYFPSSFRSGIFIWKNFDLGNKFLWKSLGQWIEMRKTFLPLKFNNSCISGRTPSGMLTYLKTPDNSGPATRWNNHYSFIQGTLYHYEPHDVGINGYDYYEGEERSISNYEESLVITDPQIYALNIVNPVINVDMRQRVKRKTIGFHIPWIKKKRGFPWFKLTWKYIEIVIWKRTYHNLGDSENNDVVSRVYDYVLKP